MKDLYLEAASKKLDKMDKGEKMLEDGKQGIIHKATLGSDKDVDYFIEKLAKLEMEYHKTICNVYVKGDGLKASLPTVSLEDGTDLTGAFSTMKNTLKAHIGMYKSINVEVTCGTWNAPNYNTIKDQWPWGDGKSSKFMNPKMSPLPTMDTINQAVIKPTLESILPEADGILEEQSGKVIGLNVGKHPSKSFLISEKVTSITGMGTKPVQNKDNTWSVKIITK
jgi:hypothetical protein